MWSRFVVVLVLAAAGCDSCSGGCGSAQAPAQQPAALKAEPATSAAPPKPEPKPDKPSYPPPGFHKVERRDDAQLCVFSSYLEAREADMIDKVTAQTLAAGEPVVFGTYPGYCVRKGCDDLPSMECGVEREGERLIVRSRYWGLRSDDGVCSDPECHPVYAACRTPPLEAGTYTVKHGHREFELTIPSKLAAPCLDSDSRPPPLPMDD